MPVQTEVDTSQVSDLVRKAADEAAAVVGPENQMLEDQRRKVQADFRHAFAEGYLRRLSNGALKFQLQDNPEQGKLLVIVTPVSDVSQDISMSPPAGVSEDTIIHMVQQTLGRVPVVQARFGGLVSFEDRMLDQILAAGNDREAIRTIIENYERLKEAKPDLGFHFFPQDKKSKAVQLELDNVTADDICQSIIDKEVLHRAQSNPGPTPVADSDQMHLNSVRQLPQQVQPQQQNMMQAVPDPHADMPHDGMQSNAPASMPDANSSCQNYPNNIHAQNMLRQPQNPPQQSTRQPMPSSAVQCPEVTPVQQTSQHILNNV